MVQEIWVLIMITCIRFRMGSGGRLFRREKQIFPTDISFWIGAMCGQGQENHGFHCLEPDDEPGYDGLAEDGEKVREGFVMMRYSKDDGRYYYWDMPNDVLAARESLTGKIGYICEFDGRQ